MVGMSEKGDLGLSDINKKLYAYLSQIMGIRAYDIMDSPVAVNPEMNIVDVAKIMDENEAGAVIIVDKNKSIKGIITFRDIVTRVVARELEASKVRAGDIMTENVYFVPADATLEQVAAVMLKFGVRRVPVVNKFGKLVGIINARDLIGFLSMQRDLLTRVIATMDSELKKYAEEIAKKKEEEEEESGLYG